MRTNLLIVHRQGARAMVAALCLAAALAGCESLETQKGQTIATGAGAGAVLGGIIGALLCPDSRAGCAAGGAAVGGLLGAGAGYYVNAQNESYTTTEQGIAARRTAAAKEAQSFRKVATESEAAVRKRKTEIAQLKEQLRRGQIDADQARRRTAAMQDDASSMRSAIDSNRKVQAALEQDIARLRRERADTASLEQSQRDLVSSNRRIQRQLDELNGALAGLPTA